MRFLDCVDRRDGRGAAELCHPDASWVTASPFGDVHGATNIQTLIETQLPARKYGPQYARHRLASAADVDDLAVITPAGERCRFLVEVEYMCKEEHPVMVVRNLVRILDQSG